MSSGVRVEEVARVDDEIVDALARLVPQLSPSTPGPAREVIEGMVASPATTLLVARDDTGRIIGSLTLAVFDIPTGMRAWIEDVVVDDQCRGSGAGAALVEAALALAGSRGALTVDLTSRPAREAANRLYLRCGFEARATNVYRHRGEPPGA